MLLFLSSQWQSGDTRGCFELQRIGKAIVTREIMLAKNKRGALPW